MLNAMLNTNYIFRTMETEISDAGFLCVVCSLIQITRLLTSLKITDLNMEILNLISNFLFILKLDSLGILIVL